MNRAEQPVDLAHLDRYTGGDRALDEEILLLFANQCRESLARLDEIAAGVVDAKAWRQATHTLKGAARGVGAFALGDAAAAAEKAGTERESALAALQRLKHDSAAVQIFIEQFLKTRV